MTVRRAHLLRELAIDLATDRDGRTWLGYTDSRVAVVERDGIRVFTSADGLEVGNVRSISVRVSTSGLVASVAWRSWMGSAFAS